MSFENQRFIPIKPLNFYSQRIQEQIEEIDQFSKSQCSTKDVKVMPRSLLGPTHFRTEFYKQAQAFQIINEKKDETLRIFVQQNDSGHRMFIVAHPEVYWWNFINKLTPDRRCAYELIPESEPCCLYLDLEFEVDLNPDKNGVEMTKTIMEIICGYINKYWSIKCTEKNIINLDSTTEKKFSRHLIFRIKDIAFKDNFHVGRLLKNIIADIELYIATNGSLFHDVLSFIERKDLESLFINTDKKKKIFIDTAVYTKNRHFRIYKATKWGKFSYLERAKECTYQLIKKNKDIDLGFFLESLISWFSDKTDLAILEFDKDFSDCSQKNQMTQGLRSPTKDMTKLSPYPAIDKFIETLIEPGVIRLSKYFRSTKVIVYDISGNKFCANIGRSHKSNGIYWIADLRKKIAYQKCHDEDDCPNFRSAPIPLPPEISFVVDDDDDDIFLNIPDDLNESSLSNNSDHSF